jgi:hypothetical protein
MHSTHASTASSVRTLPDGRVRICVSRTFASTRLVAAALFASGLVIVAVVTFLHMKPYAGNPHVRFELGPQETEPARHRA